MNPWLLLFLAIFFLGSAAGCGGDEETTATELLRAENALTVYVVQDEETEAAIPEWVDSDEFVQVASVANSEVLVATLNTYPRVIPMEWGDPSADPETDYMLVTVYLEDEFISTIRHVELSINPGDGTDEWCKPMIADAAVPGQFYLKLQPACEERDPLTGQCNITDLSCDIEESESQARAQLDATVNVSGCRQDWLTFSFWDATSQDCHD